MLRIGICLIYPLSRSLIELLTLSTVVQCEYFTAKGAKIVFHKENLTFAVDRQDPYQKMMMTMLGAVAELERNLILERQREGIALAKLHGKYKGGQPKLNSLTQADEHFSIALGTVLSLGSNAYDIFSSSQVETKRAILNIVLANFKLDGQKFSYDLRKPFDWVQSLNKKTPSKKEGVAIGEPDGIRTHDPLIKSQMLYQLSYGPAHLTKQSIMDKKRLVNKKIQKN